MQYTEECRDSLQMWNMTQCSLVDMYQATQSHIPEDSNLRI